jgi:hypothetical protein
VLLKIRLQLSTDAQMAGPPARMQEWRQARQHPLLFLRREKGELDSPFLTSRALTDCQPLDKVAWVRWIYINQVEDLVVIADLDDKVPPASNTARQIGGTATIRI